MYVVLSLANAHAHSGLVFLVCGLLTRSRLAAVCAYLVLILSAFSAPILILELHVWPTPVLMFPPLAYIRAAQLTIGTRSLHIGTKLGTALAYLVLSGSLALVLGPYFHTVTPDYKGAHSRSPFFLFAPLLRRLNLCQSHRRNPSSSTPLLTGHELPEVRAAIADASESEGDGAFMDEDVAMERQRILTRYPETMLGAAAGDTDQSATQRDSSGRLQVQDAIVVHRLHKVFQGSGSRQAKVAVNDLCLGVPYGECLGLLGPNGAGKTTAISILSGAMSPSTGYALLGGYDVATQLDSVHQVLGICPQFDTVWPDLTVSDHLHFYARLKGIPRGLIRPAVQQVAERVGLDGDPLHGKSADLSGGMRRRLSLAIALIGNPPIVFLDEPTTGLVRDFPHRYHRALPRDRRVSHTPAQSCSHHTA